MIGIAWLQMLKSTSFESNVVLAANNQGKPKLQPIALRLIFHAPDKGLDKSCPCEMALVLEHLGAGESPTSFPVSHCMQLNSAHSIDNALAIGETV